MFNEEVTEAGEVSGTVLSKSDVGSDYYEEAGRIRREQVFQEIDCSKRKCKIVCTLG